MLRTKQTKPAVESFELKKNAMEGIEEAVFWHTVGILADLGNGLGTGVAIRFRKHRILLTANHVIKDTVEENLRFFFRPPGTLKRNDWWQGAPKDLRLASPQPARILTRLQDPGADLAALVVTPQLETQNNVRFFELSESFKLPRPIPSSVAAIGFPVDSRRPLGPVAAAVAPTPLWGNIETGKHWRPKGYNPRGNLLLKFAPAEEGRHPAGFSGAGVWYHQPTPTPGIWSPSLGLAGIITHYYPRQHLLLISSVGSLITFLRKNCPA